MFHGTVDSDSGVKAGGDTKGQERSPAPALSTKKYTGLTQRRNCMPIRKGWRFSNYTDQIRPEEGKWGNKYTVIKVKGKQSSSKTLIFLHSGENTTYK